MLLELSRRDEAGVCVFCYIHGHERVVLHYRPDGGAGSAHGGRLNATSETA